MTRPNVHAVHRSWEREYPIVERAEGIYLFDREGKRYIDGSGGSAVVTAIGHAVDEVPRAMYAQAQKFSFSPAHAFTHAPMLDLADLVVDLAPGGLKGNSRVWITCTGTDATDDAVRLARQYWVERGKPGKYQIITRWQGFHGNSISAAGYSGLVARRKMFLPMFVESPHIPPAFCYHCPFELTLPSCKLKCARSLETAIRQQGAENVAAFIAEPVVGASLGAVPAPEGYFESVREICDRYEVLFIADEVMTGWGRTGAMWAIEHSGVTPDILTSAKGVTSGYTPLALVIARDEIWAVLENARSPFRAGHTFNANAVSCAGAMAAIRYLVDHNLVQNSRERGLQAQAGLCRMMEHHPIVGDVRGLGLMFGLEYVRTRDTREPFPPELHVSALIDQAAMRLGLVTYPCSGAVEGVLGDMTLFAPPLVIAAAELDDLMAILDRSIGEVEANLPKA